MKEFVLEIVQECKERPYKRKLIFAATILFIFSFVVGCYWSWIGFDLAAVWIEILVIFLFIDRKISRSRVDLP